MDEIYAKKYEFYPYKGTRRGKLWRIWSIAWVNLVHQLNRSLLVKIWLGFIIFILILSNLMLLIGAPSMLPTGSPNEILEDHLWGTIRKFVRFQVLIVTPDESDPVFDTGYSIFMLIGLIMIGAGLISDDQKYRISEIYDSKIDRKDYLVGKFGSLVLFGNLLFTLPCIIEWGLLIVGINGVDIIRAIPVLFGTILFTEILIIVLASFILTFSSLTETRLYSGIFAFGFFLSISKIISGIIGVAESFTPLMYMDFFTVLSVLSYIIQGEKSVAYYDTTLNGVDFNLMIDLTGRAGFLILPFLAFFICFSLSICCYQVVWKRYSPLYSLKRFVGK
ncbi:MAG: hypothetical protein ACFFAU_00365 [Candidatus Hodarchaeota archaeon]